MTRATDGIGDYTTVTLGLQKGQAMSRVLVLGGTGMLGHKLVQVLGATSGLEVHATVREPPPKAFAAATVTYHAGIALSWDLSGFRKLLERLAPDVVINAAGAIKQRDLSSAVEETFFINGTLPHLIPLMNPNKDARVLHFSTDCVFRGDRGAYTEADPPDVEDLYGRSKACGEIDYGRHLTLRTSIVGFEFRGHLGLLAWLLQQPRGSRLPGFTGAIYSGLPTVTLSRTVRDLLGGHTLLTGLYHVASEPISKFDLLQRVSEALNLGHELVRDSNLSVDRSLDDSRFRAATGTRRPQWDALVRDLVEDFHSLPYSDVYSVKIPSTGTAGSAD